MRKSWQHWKRVWIQMFHNTKVHSSKDVRFLFVWNSQVPLLFYRNNIFKRNRMSCWTADNNSSQSSVCYEWSSTFNSTTITFIVVSSNTNHNIISVNNYNVSSGNSIWNSSNNASIKPNSDSNFVNYRSNKSCPISCICEFTGSNNIENNSFSFCFVSSFVSIFHFLTILFQKTQKFNSNVERLKEIFPSIEESVLEYALRFNDYNLENTVFDLMETDKVNNYRIRVQSGKYTISLVILHLFDLIDQFCDLSLSLFLSFLSFLNRNPT